VAFTQPLPHPIERAYIDRQVEEYAVYMESAIDALSEGNDTVPLGDMHAREFRRRYFALRDIRFVPYFKQVYLPGDLAMVAHLNRDLEEFAAGLRSGYSPPAGEGARERNARRHRGDAQMILASLLRAYFRDKPSPLRLRQLPERNVKGFSMRPNESNIWTYSIDQAEPFPPYSPEGAAGDTAP
jgi:hypothetical protein